MHFMRSFAIVAIALMSVAAPAKAAIIDFVLTGELSGDLDGTGFTDAAFTLTFSGDTDDLVPFPNGILFDTITAPVFTISGLPTATVTEPSIFGFNDDNDIAFLAGVGPDFLGFTLPDGTDIGSPIAPTAVGILYGDWVDTDQGPLDLNGIDGPIDAIFSSTIAGDVPTVGSLPLLLTGIGLLLIGARRRKAV